MREKRGSGLAPASSSRKVRFNLLGVGRSLRTPGGQDTPPRNAAQFINRNLLIHESHPAMSARYGMGWVRAAL